jgi:hypothetical protein
MALVCPLGVVLLCTCIKSLLTTSDRIRGE